MRPFFLLPSLALPSLCLSPSLSLSRTLSLAHPLSRILLAEGVEFFSFTFRVGIDAPLFRVALGSP